MGRASGGTPLVPGESITLSIPVKGEPLPMRIRVILKGCRTRKRLASLQPRRLPAPPAAVAADRFILMGISETLFSAFPARKMRKLSGRTDDNLHPQAGLGNLVKADRPLPAGTGVE